jgi:hypothetical protein
VKFPLNSQLNCGIHKELVQGEPAFNENNCPLVESGITNQWRSDLIDANNVVYDGTNRFKFQDGRVNFNGRPVANVDSFGIEKQYYSNEPLSYDNKGNVVVPHYDLESVWLSTVDGEILWKQDVTDIVHVLHIPNRDVIFAVASPLRIADRKALFISESGITEIASTQLTNWIFAQDFNSIIVARDWKPIGKWGFANGTPNNVWVYDDVTGIANQLDADYIGFRNGDLIATKKLPSAYGMIYWVAINVNDGQVVTNNGLIENNSNNHCNAAYAGPGFYAVQYDSTNTNGYLVYLNDETYTRVQTRGGTLDTIAAGSSALGTFTGDTDVDIRSFSCRVHIDYNVHLLVNQGTQIGLSYVENGSHALGTTLTGVASMMQEWPTTVNRINVDGTLKTYISYKLEDGRSAVVILSNSIPIKDRFIKLSHNLWKINTVSVNNLIVINNGVATMQLGSVDYNGRLLLERTVQSAVTREINANWLGCGFNLNYENSSLRSIGFLAGQTQINARCILQPKGTEMLHGNSLYTFAPLSASRPTNVQGVTVPIDVYYSNDMATVNNRYGGGTGIAQYAGTFLDDSLTMNAKLLGLSLPANVPGVLISPIPITTTVKTIIDSNPLVSVEDAFVRLWEANNLFYDGTASTAAIPTDLGKIEVFGFQGTTYVYDGNSIWRILPADSVNIIGEFVYITNLSNSILVGTASTEAFFYNTANKNLYSFSGDRTVSVAIPMHLENTVFTGGWNSHEQMLYYANDEKVFVLDAMVLHSFPHSFGKDVAFKFLDNGTLIYSTSTNEGFLRTKYPLTDDELLTTREEIHIESALLGTDGQEVVGWENVQFYIHVPNRKSVTIKLSAKAAFEDKTFGEKQRIIEVKSNSLDAGGNTTVQIVPKFTQAIGMAWRFETTDEVKLLAVYVTPSQTGRTKTVKFSGGK